MLSKSNVISQAFSYGLIGVISNVSGFLIYILLTWASVDPKLAVSFVYPAAALVGYFGNSRYAFSYSGSHVKGLWRYFIAHLIGYSINIFILYVFVDLIGYSHISVQAAAIFVVAGVLFLLFRYYVFTQAQST